MKSDLVDKAREIVPHPPLLINMISKRVRQLNGGRTALVERKSGMGLADVALTEIIEKKIVITENGDLEEADDA